MGEFLRPQRAGTGPAGLGQLCLPGGCPENRQIRGYQEQDHVLLKSKKKLDYMKCEKIITFHKC